jgi:hypothetical protein
MLASAPLDRRAFLRATGMSAAMLAVARLRPLPAALASDPPNGVRVLSLSPGDARILAALAERITLTGDPQMPAFAETEALATIDAALRQLSPDIVQQLSWGLWLFEYGPPVLIGRLSTFTGLSPEWQDVYLTTWEQSRFQVRRIAFQAIKNLAFLGYYSQDATWKGIHYQGPWVPMPRVVVGGDGWIKREA